MRNHYKRWTEEEIEYLENWIGRSSLGNIAKRLGRTFKSVEFKATELGIGDSLGQTGMLTKNELARFLKVCPKTVSRWIEKYGLKAKKLRPRRKRYYIMIDVEDFWEWAEQNKEKIDFGRIERYSLLPEPEWFELERKRDLKNIPRRKRKKWTKEEESQLIQLNNMKMPLNEIGKRLNRSETAIKRRISRLRQAGKIKKERIVLMWTDEEVEMMLSLEKQGLSDEIIAEELGREADHIRDKRKRMRENGEYEGYKERSAFS